MKRIAFFSIIILFILPFTAFAQGNISEAGSNTQVVTPPNRVQANFNARYPDFSRTPQWRQSERGYQATFRQNRLETVSEFDQDGNWLESRTELPESDWPDNTRNYINDTYQDYEYLNGYRYDDPNGRRYELDLRSQDNDFRLNFDGDGGFVQESGIE